MAKRHYKSRHPIFKNLAGHVFGRLTVVRETGLNKRGRVLWACQCECGNEAVVNSGALISGNTRSCGCLAKEINATACKKHGESTRNLTPEYRAWRGMITRCTNRKIEAAKTYGVKGTKVCDRWKNSYEAFLADMGRRPSAEHSIDRIDNDGDYEPGNCRWATRTEQQRNTSRNRFLTVNGETRCVSEWSNITGIHCQTILSRLRIGLTPEQALGPPRR